MKNVHKHIVTSLLLVFIFASCGVQKRLHNPGYYVQLNKNYKTDKETTNISKTENEIKSVEKETTLAVTPIVNEKNAPAKIVETTNPTAMNDVATNDESIFNQPPTTTKRHLIQSSYVKENPSISQPAKIKTTNLKKDSRTITGGTAAASGGAIVLFVILCFFPFINLIPVYLTDGSVTMNFWLTLILDLLTVIGGIIFALLVVLGVVSIG